jgi:hypothetical protein
VPLYKAPHWEHYISTEVELAYARAQRAWLRFEGELPFRLGDCIRLPEATMRTFLAAAGTTWTEDLPPSLLTRRATLVPLKSHHVVAPKNIP